MNRATLVRHIDELKSRGAYYAGPRITSWLIESAKPTSATVVLDGTFSPSPAFQGTPFRTRVTMGKRADGSWEMKTQVPLS
jgi:hypothetical protein